MDTSCGTMWQKVNLFVSCMIVFTWAAEVNDFNVEYSEEYENSLWSQKMSVPKELASKRLFEFDGRTLLDSEISKNEILKSKLDTTPTSQHARRISSIKDETLVKIDFGTSVSKVASGFLKADGSLFGEGPGDGHQGYKYGWSCDLNDKDSTRSRGAQTYRQNFPEVFDLMDDLIIPDRHARCGKPAKFMLELPAGKYVVKVSFMDTDAASLSNAAGCRVQGQRVGDQTMVTSCNTPEDSACQVFTVEVREQHRHRLHLGGTFATGCKAINHMEVYFYRPDLANLLITYKPIVSGYKDAAIADKIDPVLKEMINRVVDPEVNIVAVTSVNAGYIDMASNWLCSVKKLGIKNYIIYATDAETEKYFKERGENVYRYDVKKITGDSLSSGSVKYGSVAYQELIFARTKFVNMVLSMGINTLLCDIDAVWLSNPYKYFHFDHDIEAQQEVDGRLCGGFILLMSTANTVTLWHRVTARHERLVRRAEKTHKLRNIDESEQTLFMELIPKMSIAVRKLDKNLFPTGLRFFGDQMSFRSRMPPGSHPVVVHNNYVIGHSKKVRRFEHFKLWFVREAQPGVYVCKDNITITIPDFSPQLKILMQVLFLSFTFFLLQC